MVPSKKELKQLVVDKVLKARTSGQDRDKEGRRKTYPDLQYEASWEVAKSLLDTSEKRHEILKTYPEMWDFQSEYDFYGSDLNDLFLDVVTWWIYSLLGT